MHAKPRGVALERLAAWDRLLCRRFNQASHVPSVRFIMLMASWLGNGIFWYALGAALLLLDTAHAVPVVTRMVVTGLVCTVLYKWIKARTSRSRPSALQLEITVCTAPLDQYSFPSGHTLHATAFALVAVTYYPMLFWLVMPFTVLVALSRVVLGLHYPSDVLVGAALGAGIAGVSIAI